MPQLYTDETQPGVLQVVWSSIAGDEFVGESLQKVVPAYRSFGKERVRRVGAELVQLSSAEYEEVCAGSNQLFEGVSALPLTHVSFDHVNINPDIGEKYMGKILFYDVSTSPCGSRPLPQIFCKHFPNTTVIWSRYLTTWLNTDGNSYQGWEHCELWNIDSTGTAQLPDLLKHMGPNVTLLANLETTSHPVKHAFDSTWTSLFFSWVPSLLCLILAQFALRSLFFRWSQEWRTGGGRWYVLLSLIVNSITLPVLSVLYFLDGASTNLNSPLSWTEQNILRTAFSLTRIGVNLSISICWLDLKSALTAKSTSKVKRRLLEFGVLLFCLAEIPVSVLLLDYRTSAAFVLLVPKILLMSESLVATFFIVSGVSTLKKLNQITQSSSTFTTNLDVSAIKRVSTLFILSGVNSVLNICFFIFLTLFLDSVLNSSVLYLGMFGPLIYFRLIDAFLQLLVLKPNHVPVGLSVLAQNVSAFTSMSTRTLLRVMSTRTLLRVTSKYKVNPLGEHHSEKTGQHDTKRNALSEAALDSRWQTAVN